MNYLLIGTDGSDEPRYCGAYIYGEYETLDEAKAALHLEAAGWGKERCVFDPATWQRGYCSDPEGAKYADEYWSADDLTAWRGMNQPNGWVRLEIAERGEDGWKIII